MSRHGTVRLARELNCCNRVSREEGVLIFLFGQAALTPSKNGGYTTLDLGAGLAYVRIPAKASRIEACMCVCVLKAEPGYPKLPGS